jgi:hypothetical protein
LFTAEYGSLDGGKPMKTPGVVVALGMLQSSLSE